MKPAGRSVTVLCSWFNSFKTDLETYIYITLQKAIYNLNSACSAAALVNLTPEPKPKNFLQQSVCQGPQRRNSRGGNGCHRCVPQPKPLFRHPNSPGLCYILPYLRAPGWHESTDNLSNLTHAECLTHKERKGEKKKRGGKKESRKREEDGERYRFLETKMYSTIRWGSSSNNIPTTKHTCQFQSLSFLGGISSLSKGYSNQPFVPMLPLQYLWGPYEKIIDKTTQPIWVLFTHNSETVQQ